MYGRFKERIFVKYHGKFFPYNHSIQVLKKNDASTKAARRVTVAVVPSTNSLQGMKVGVELSADSNFANKIKDKDKDKDKKVERRSSVSMRAQHCKPRTSIHKFSIE